MPAGDQTRGRATVPWEWGATGLTPPGKRHCGNRLTACDEEADLHLSELKPEFEKDDKQRAVHTLLVDPCSQGHLSNFLHCMLLLAVLGVLAGDLAWDRSAAPLSWGGEQPRKRIRFPSDQYHFHHRFALQQIRFHSGLLFVQRTWATSTQTGFA